MKKSDYILKDISSEIINGIPLNNIIIDSICLQDFYSKRTITFTHEWIYRVGVCTHNGKYYAFIKANTNFSQFNNILDESVFPLSNIAEITKAKADKLIKKLTKLHKSFQKYNFNNFSEIMNRVVNSLPFPYEYTALVGKNTYINKRPQKIIIKSNQSEFEILYYTLYAYFIYLLEKNDYKGYHAERICKFPALILSNIYLEILSIITTELKELTPDTQNPNTINDLFQTAILDAIRNFCPPNLESDLFNINTYELIDTMNEYLAEKHPDIVKVPPISYADIFNINETDLVYTVKITDEFCQSFVKSNSDGSKIWKPSTCIELDCVSNHTLFNIIKDEFFPIFKQRNYS